MNLNEHYQRDNEIFNQLMHQSPIGIAIVDKRGVLVDCNKALGDMLGYSQEELLNLSFEDFTHPEDLNKEWPMIKNMWNGEIDKYHIIKRYIHKSGEIIWVDLVGSILYKNKEKSTLGFAFVQDITERVKAKEELKRSKEYYQGVIEDQTELIVRWKFNGILTFVNNSYCEYFEKKRDELIGKSFLALIPEEDRHLINENIANITLENPIASHEHRVIKSDGSIGWTEWVNRGIFNEQGGIIEYQSVGRDITERKKAEKIMRLARDRSEFYKDLLAHDISNIFNNIKLSLKLLKLEKQDPQTLIKKKEAINIIEDQIKRGSSLISNVRSFSVLDNEEQTIKSVDIKNVLHNAIESIKSRFNKENINIKMKIDEDISIVSAGDMLYNAFENLILNGIMHNRNDLKVIWINASKIQLNDGKYVKLEFKDNGIGISNERKKNIFQRTYDRENLTGGMGIGLSLVSRIIELYEGKLSVENRIYGDYTKGSNFIVYLKEI
ncbi:MAG: PAS domain S-box protein [Promethearchaeota archaeon]|nr:MAG: PAS domain S-box protein [Candidatus Lokiarchaeota archaeon]